jgi:hypothetical protein
VDPSASEHVVRLTSLDAARVRVGSVVTLFGACLALPVLYVLFTWGEREENRYINSAEASEMQRRGWLPATLPRSATEIHEWHDLDTNVCFGSFRFDPKERSTIELMLRPGQRRTMRIDRDPSFASPLPRDPREDQLVTVGFEFYSEPGFDLAISWKAGIAYFWN